MLFPREHDTTAENTDWFLNSYNHVMNKNHEKDGDEFYQEYFGVKFHYLGTNSNDIVDRVEFPSEEAGLMFILQWSSPEKEIT